LADFFAGSLADSFLLDLEAAVLRACFAIPGSPDSRWIDSAQHRQHPRESPGRRRVSATCARALARFREAISKKCKAIDVAERCDVIMASS
jgi:hypothetical protein